MLLGVAHASSSPYVAVAQLGQPAFRGGPDEPLLGTTSWALGGGFAVALMPRVQRSDALHMRSLILNGALAVLGAIALLGYLAVSVAARSAVAIAPGFGELLSS